MLGDDTPAAVRKLPPTQSAGPAGPEPAAIAFTVALATGPNAPGDDHAEPSHFARCGVETGPQVRNAPPAYSAAPDPSSKLAIARTSSVGPVPAVVHTPPTRRATFCAVGPWLISPSPPA